MSHAHIESHYGESGAQHEAIPLDPEHDIDAKSAARWVIGGAVVFFVGMWLLLPIFTRVLEFERRQKIGLAPTTERNDVEDAEGQFLEGANPTKKRIDDVIAKLRKK